MTAEGATVMTVTRPGVTLVDSLNPERETFTVPANGQLRITVPAQRALILVPESDASR